MMVKFEIKKGQSRVVAAAIHDGHEIRPELLSYIKLTKAERLREEDPFTGNWLKISDNQIKVKTSRFEVDLNRIRNKAVYRQPSDAWGLDVWKTELPDEVVEKSLQLYDDFYSRLAYYFDDLLEKQGYLIVYDLHSYNHRREGPERFASPEENPEVNIGTGNMNRAAWSEVVDALIGFFRQYNFEGRYLGVGENIKFRGGYFGQWLFERYGDLVCVLSIEFKKFFMNEWTGKPYNETTLRIGEMLFHSIVPVIQQASLISVAK